MARFNHENGTGLRLQCFLIVRDEKRRVACLRLADNPQAWNLPGESMRLNEDPRDAAQRVASTWFETPLAPRLADVYSYPATGPDDDRWYLLFVYEADAPVNLKGTPDTLEVKFVAPKEAPGPFAHDHVSVFAKISP